MSIQYNSALGRSKDFVATNPSQLVKFLNGFRYKFLIKLKNVYMFLLVNFIHIAGKEVVVSGNSSIINRSFLISIKEVEKYLQVFLPRIYHTCIYFQFLFILYTCHTRSPKYRLIFKAVTIRGCEIIGSRNIKDNRLLFSLINHRNSRSNIE